MLIKLKKERTHQEDRRLALWLATSAGLLNAIALGAFGFFPSHMTGNTSQFSSEVSSTDLNDIIFFATIILAFVTGQSLHGLLFYGALFIMSGSFFVRFCLLKGYYWPVCPCMKCFFIPSPPTVKLLFFSAAWMGIHNSTSTQLSGGRVRSTHITGTLTDAGISLASVVVAMLRRDYSKDTAGQKNQLITHLTTLFSFITGGIAGLILFRWFGFNAMLALGVILVLVAAFSIVSTSLRVRKVRAALSKS
ncbi:Predicted membrane protein [Leclercia adecarboxylata]|uniref:Predicted membrane protein n=1 Tax=Leclercia adecarboxylata TaxID=83655 RepID=A0A4U9HUL3_9ENTR|nr:Predicted membrane protein [Leclercia adecarboxylata]